MINFITHEVRAGKQGAREDFEQMLGLLVQATHGQAHLVFAEPGDWGIDVLVGNLNGRATIWQAKYFIHEFKQPQKRQVDESFQSAMQNAARRGYTVDRWVLCVPLSLNPPTLQWWQEWQARQEHEYPGMSVELWDENKLRSLLIKPEAIYVRRAYYELPGGSDAADQPLAVTVPWSVTPTAPWQGGAAYELGQETYLLHDPACERVSRDGSYVWREATAERVEPVAVPGRFLVRFRQMHVDRRTTAAEEQLAGLRAQSALLTQLNGRAELPRLVRDYTDPDGMTLVTTHPSGHVWRELFGPGPDRAAPLTAAAAFAAAADAALALGFLHDIGASHRALHPGALFIDGTRCRLRDAGLAAIPPVIGEGGTGAHASEVAGADVWRAPEQRRSAYLAGPATDVYQLAAIVYCTLTGHPPAPAGTPPARAALPEIPEATDVVLLRGLDIDPARRPDIRQLMAAFRDGRRALSLCGEV